MRVNALTFAPVMRGAAVKNCQNRNVTSPGEDSTEVSKEIYNPPFYRNHPSFGKRFTVDDRLEQEARYSEIARNAGVNNPKVYGYYDIKGEIADFDENPVSDEQIKATLDEILKLDKAGLYHGDIEKAHLFFKQNSNKPELDCFRFGFMFDEDKGRRDWEFPECTYPTNILQFENNWMGYYMSKMNDEQKDDFLGRYLPMSADFHAQKAQYLKDENLGTPEQIEFEELQARVYQNPTQDIIELLKDRIAVCSLEREAFTECDEGNGACGHEKDENRVIRGNFYYFEMLKNNLKYMQKIDDVKNRTDYEDTLKLLDYYKKCSVHKNDNQLEANRGRTTWSVNPDNPDNLCHKTPAPEELKSYELMYKGLLQASKKGNRSLEYDMIQMTEGQYGILINRTKS